MRCALTSDEWVAGRTAVYLSLLSEMDMSAVQIGHVLHGESSTGIRKAREWLLAMRRKGLVDTEVEREDAPWRLLPQGRGWLDECLNDTKPPPWYEEEQEPTGAP